MRKGDWKYGVEWKMMVEVSRGGKGGAWWGKGEPRVGEDEKGLLVI